MSVAEAVYLGVSAILVAGAAGFWWGQRYGFNQARDLYFTREAPNSGEPKSKRTTRTRSAQSEESSRVVKAKYRRRR